MNMPNPFLKSDKTPFASELFASTAQVEDLDFNIKTLVQEGAGLTIQYAAIQELDKGVFGTKKVAKITTDDARFTEWYSNSANYDSALCYFGLLSIIAFHCVVKRHETVTLHLQYQLLAKWASFCAKPGPKVTPNVSSWFASNLRAQLSPMIDANRGLLKYLLFTFHKMKFKASNSQADGFFGYAIATPFKSHGFHLIDLFNRAAESMNTFVLALRARAAPMDTST